MRTHAHVPQETHSASSKSWEQLCLAGPLPPSHRSGHLINVTQYHVWLHQVFLHSLSAGSPKPAAIINFCSLGNYQRLGLEKSKNESHRASLLTLFPPFSSLWCFIQNHYTHKPYSESHLQQAGLKKKKKKLVIGGAHLFAIAQRE